jgi:hypothetical protein
MLQFRKYRDDSKTQLKFAFLVAMAKSNNGMHPTRNSAAFIINIAGGQVMPGVMRCVVDSL